MTGGSGLTTSPRAGAKTPVREGPQRERRYVAWFHELDAWSEYWDVYHPETHGRYYFGDRDLGGTEPGLLTEFLTRARRPPVFVAWSHMALALDGGAEAFVGAARAPGVGSAVMEVDNLLARLFAKHFGDDADDRA